MTTKTTKIADRYAALVAAATSDGVAFEAAKRPTSKDCEELSAKIDAHRASLAAAAEEPKAKRTPDEIIASWKENAKDDMTFDAVVGMVDESISAVDADDIAPTPAEERAAAIEAKRVEARRRFETATRATTAHGYALIAAATADGDRMTNLRARLAEMPEAVRASACKLAAEKLVQSGSTMQKDLRSLYDEQPIAAKGSTTRGSEDRNEWTVKVHKRFAYVRLHKDMKSEKVTIKKMVIDGRTALVVFPL